MLTRKQHELLMLIHDRLKETGVPPSFEEMKEALDLKSKSGVHRLISALEERGFIRRLREDEGTWMAHIWEHAAIELQNMAGSDVSFGKTRGMGQPERRGPEQRDRSEERRGPGTPHTHTDATAGLVPPFALDRLGARARRQRGRRPRSRTRRRPVVLSGDLVRPRRRLSAEAPGRGHPGS